MKYFIFDSTNDGVIWTGQNIAIANKLKEGLIDCDMTQFNQYHPSYNKITPEILASGHITWNSKSGTIDPMTANNINDVYKLKKSFASIRSIGLHKLISFSTWAYRKTLPFPHTAIDSDLTWALDNCNPDQNDYDYSIKEYALICNMTVEEAYKQLKLRAENFRTQRLRVYSYYDYFADKINKSTKKKEIDSISEEMYKKFVKDSFI